MIFPGSPYSALFLRPWGFKFLLLNRPESTPCFSRSRMAPENSAGQAISFFEGPSL